MKLVGRPCEGVERMKMKNAMGRRLRLSALTVMVGAMLLNGCASAPGEEEQTEAAAGGTTDESGQGDDGGSLETEGERSEEHTSELQSRFDLVCRLLLEKKKKNR